MRANTTDEFRSRVYTERPEYADLPAPEKFATLESIIITRLLRQPKAICSYSGGSDSDILIDLIERTRQFFNNACGREALAPVKYVFFNTGLEMEATKRHVKEVAEKYGVEIEEKRPKKNIVQATREYGQPFVSKIMSAAMETVQKKGLPLSIKEEYDAAVNKAAKRQELRERYPKAEQGINFFVLLQFCGRATPEYPACYKQLKVYVRVYARKSAAVQDQRKVLRLLQKASRP